MRNPAGPIPTLLSLLLLALALNPAAPAQENSSMTTTAVKKNLAIDVELSGTFQAEDKTRVAMEPEEYSGELIVKTIIEEGALVEEGDILMEFEPDKVKKAITKAENAVDDEEVKLKKAQADLEALRIDQELALKRHDMELKLATQAVAGETEKVNTKIKEKETEIRRRENSYQDKKINFLQLQKLYDSRDLHTDTETILVEREKKAIEEAELDLAKLKMDFDHFKKYELNVALEEKKLDLLKKEAEKKKDALKFSADLAEKEAAVRKAEREMKEATDKVDNLNLDLGNLTVAAPRKGIVFYGTPSSGDMFGDVVIFGGSNVRQNLRIGGRVKTHVTLLTVASMDKLSVEMKAPENDIQHMKKGLRITLRPDAFPDLAIPGKLVQVDQIASRSGFMSSVQEFKVKASYEGTFPQLRAGMNCRVTVHADSIPDAIQVPVIAVFQEEGNYYCYQEEGGKPERRQVKLGATNGKQVQITEGLRAGATVYLYDPYRE